MGKVSPAPPTVESDPVGYRGGVAWATRVVSEGQEDTARVNRSNDRKYEDITAKANKVIFIFAMGICIVALGSGVTWYSVQSDLQDLKIIGPGCIVIGLGLVFVGVGFIVRVLLIRRRKLQWERLAEGKGTREQTGQDTTYQLEGATDIGKTLPGALQTRAPTLDDLYGRDDQPHVRGASVPMTTGRALEGRRSGEAGSNSDGHCDRLMHRAGEDPTLLARPVIAFPQPVIRKCEETDQATYQIQMASKRDERSTERTFSQKEIISSRSNLALGSATKVSGHDENEAVSSQQHDVTNNQGLPLTLQKHATFLNCDPGATTSYSEGVSELMRDSANQSELMKDTANQSELRGDSANQSELRGDSANQSELMKDSANQSELRGDSANQSELMKESANQSELRGDSANQSELRGDSTNQSELRGDSANQSELREERVNQSEIRGDCVASSQIEFHPPMVDVTWGNEPH